MCFFLDPAVHLGKERNLEGKVINSLSNPILVSIFASWTLFCNCGTTSFGIRSHHLPEQERAGLHPSGTKQLSSRELTSG